MTWQKEAQDKIKRMPEGALEVRERAIGDLFYFAKLVNPGYMYGSVHEELFSWAQSYDLFGTGTEQTNNKLIMLPRAHLKSHIVATWCAWIVLRHPEVTILYLSATAELAQTQLYAVKNILGGDVFRRFFPEYIHPQEGKRGKWSSTGVIIDHPGRAKEGIRDDTIKTAGLTTTTTGWHADIIIADDLVTPENAYTEDGRTSVVKKASQFTSIRNTGGFTMACGTRYHPKDIYFTWKTQSYEVFDTDGIKVGEANAWDIKEYVVEKDGVFVWPRVIRGDGKAYGFDLQILARIRGEYEDSVQYHAQYYNDPNDSSSDRITTDKFQYYNPRLLRKEGSRWFYNGARLNIYAAVDFAFSLTRRSDFSAIVVIGIDNCGDIYVLDIDRFKTDKTIEYFKHVKALHAKWVFNKLSAEVTAAQKVIVNDIKSYLRKDGLKLPVVESRPTKNKEERIAAALEPRYDDQTVWHREGGWTQTLEDELVLARPPHDDIKDALASAVTVAVPPCRGSSSSVKDLFTSTTKPRNRFGGYTV